MKILLVLVLVSLQIISITADCGCLNNGVCNDDFSCTCPNGYYGPICQKYAETYKIQYEATPTGVRKIDIIDALKRELQILDIQDAFAIGLGNLYAATFHRSLTDAERSRVRTIAFAIANSERVSDLADYNECEEGKQSCFNGLRCINTKFSFRCGCPDGYHIKQNRCIQEVVDSNAKTVIYVWAAAVGGVILFTLACLMFYRHRKIEKGKKTAIEHQKKMANRGTLTPTNLSEYEGEHGRRTSPSASVVDGHNRYSMGDVASIYSYSGNYGQPDNAYYGTQSRLTIPVDGGQMNAGYEPQPDHMRYPSSTGSFTAPPPMLSGYSTNEINLDNGPVSTYNEHSQLPYSSPSAPDSTANANQFFSNSNNANNEGLNQV